MSYIDALMAAHEPVSFDIFIIVWLACLLLDMVVVAWAVRATLRRFVYRKLKRACIRLRRR